MAFGEVLDLNHVYPCRASSKCVPCHKDVGGAFADGKQGAMVLSVVTGRMIDESAPRVMDSWGLSSYAFPFR
jgi:hypothetical protein